MTNILVLNSSVSGEASVSKILVKDAVERLLEAHPRATVVQRDLDLTPVPHLTSATMPAFALLQRRKPSALLWRCPTS